MHVIKLSSGWRGESAKAFLEPPLIPACIKRSQSKKCKPLRHYYSQAAAWNDMPLHIAPKALVMDVSWSKEVSIAFGGERWAANLFVRRAIGYSYSHHSSTPKANRRFREFQKRPSRSVWNSQWSNLAVQGDCVPLGSKRGGPVLVRRRVRSCSEHDKHARQTLNTPPSLRDGRPEQPLRSFLCRTYCYQLGLPILRAFRLAWLQ